MKVSLEWLNDYVEVDRGAEQIAEILSDRGFPTEGIERIHDDVVIDVEVTSNRGDCLSHIGIARELAAALDQPLKLPQVELEYSDEQAADFVEVLIDEPDLCWRYTARMIMGVKIGPTPEWMKRRLEAVGIRSVNNVVDATNYAMMETGQPPHAFDYDKLRGKTIIVRKGKSGEELTSIDETKCKLTDEMLVIADPSGPVAIAGVMGGLDTEINDKTTTVLLEDARFDPVSIRSTGRKLGISSEASFRFERFVDTDMIDWCSQRTAQLIVQVAGGKIARGVLDAYPTRPSQKLLEMRLSRMDHLLGISIPRDEVVRILTGLGLEPRIEDDTVICTDPTWRHDLYREADVIEEVARCYGYSQVPVERKINIEVAPINKREQHINSIHTFLTGCGYFETLNVTFTDEKTASIFDGPNVDYLNVTDESRKSASLLRRTLLGSLVNVLQRNHNMGNSDCRLYEIAATFQPQPDTPLPLERQHVALVCDGDLQDVRGVLEGIVADVNRTLTLELKPARAPWAHVAADVVVDGSVIGQCGLLSPGAAKEYDLENDSVACAEIDLDTLLDRSGDIGKVKPIPRYPAITRDLSVIVDEPVTWAQIGGCVQSQAPDLLEKMEFVDIYRGKPIEKGKKSVTLSLRFRDDDGTLQHETVDAFENEIVAELQNKLGARLRTA